jgi:lathosterol oxidase
MKDKKFLKNQIQLEIMTTIKSVPWMAIPTVSIFVAEVRGYSKLYDNVEDLGISYMIFSIIFFLFFTDFIIYWIHRGLHYLPLYRHFHKVHHKWILPTPFASHAFHPVDGFLQSCPYHLFPFLFPVNKWVYLGLFGFVNFWSTSIHDANYKLPKLLQFIVLGSAHHTDHHLLFDCNYGQFFTLWDKIGGSFRNPSVYGGEKVIDEKVKVAYHAKDLKIDKLM